MSDRRPHESSPRTSGTRDPGRHDLGYQVHHLARLLRRGLEAELAPLGLTGPQAAVLLSLAAAPVRLPPSGVAERLGVDRPTLSGVLARLERDGWLLSEPNPDDGRSRLLLLTPRSESALPELRAASDRVSARALRGLGPEDVRRLAGMLDDIVRSLETGEETVGRP